MLSSQERYFDYSASAPPFKSALERFLEVSLTSFANPSSAHNNGRAAKLTYLEEKEKFCKMLNFNDGRLLLCSSGTEANNTIIEGHLKRHSGGRILISENVHSSLWYACEKYPDSVDVMQIDKNGQVSADTFKKALKPDTTLVCINHACNETGAIKRPDQVALICSQKGIKLLVDGAQAIGHIPVNMDLIQCDYYSFSAHKFGAGRSFGGLLMRDESFEPLLKGGNQEWGLRAGTENVGGLAAGVVALNESLMILEKETIRLNNLKNEFVNSLRQNIPSLIVNSPETGLPGFVSVSIPKYSGSEIVKALSIEGFSISTGSACHDNQYKPSRVILAIGRTEQEALGTVRITMGRGSTENAVKDLSAVLIAFTKR